MSAPDLTRIDASQNWFTLPVTGKAVGLWNVTFDGSRFWYGSQDVTASLTRAQKGAFPDYDPTADNLANYYARNQEFGRAESEGGSTSTFGLWVEGVSADLSLSNPNSVASALKTVLVVAGLAVAAYFVWKAIKAWKS